MKQNWIDKYSLPLASLGLMVFSAGLDGAYLAKMMPMLGGAFGYALNLVADCSCLLLSYWYGRLRQSPKDTKRHRYALALLPAEIVGVGYSWFLSWRQLRIILPAIEPDAWRWVAPVAAGFVPLLLAFTGYAQSLLAGRIKDEDIIAAAVRREAKKEREKAEQVKREEFAIEYHANRRAPDASTYAVMARDGWKCYYCGADMSSWPRDEIHVDHFYPIVAGGSDNPFNLVVSCKQCNLSKHARIPTAGEIHLLKVHLVKTLSVPAKEKVWLLQRVDGVMKQKDIASALEISPSYVSASVKERPDELSEHLTALCIELGAVGEPSSLPTELESEQLVPVGSGNGGNAR